MDADKPEDLSKVAMRAGHRLNNIVTVILANTDALLAAFPPDSEVGQCAIEIREAAGRASALSEEIFQAVKRSRQP